MAVALRPVVRKIEDREDAHLRGAITALTSIAAFEVNGLPVDAASASFPDGSAGMVLGTQVEVKGEVVNGVLVATKVELDARHAGERQASNCTAPSARWTLRPGPSHCAA